MLCRMLSTQFRAAFCGCIGLLILMSTNTAAAADAATRPTTSPHEELPDPFRFTDGHRVTSRDDWPARRKELLEQILTIEYGHLPPPPAKTSSAMLISHQYRPLLATHKQFKITCDLGEGKEKVSFVIDLLYPPGDGPFPVILHGDGCWGPTPDLIARQILDRGYILADFNRCEFAPDRADEPVGLFAAYPQHEFGAIAAWAWGYHRAVDFLITQPEIAKDKIAITAHSRGGKAVILAGATDQRIVLTAPNNSGTGGAASFRFQTAESEPLHNITKNFPTWFTPRLKDFIDRENELPFDQHSLKACIAPRALLTTEALADFHANPRGTWLTHRAAREVYAFVGHPEKIAINFRPGGHEHGADGFSTLLDFADAVFFDKSPAIKRDWNPNQFPDLPPGYSWNAPKTQAAKH
jgi:(4-O-methyl)-D-glucuronate---lignin esterase